jgi:hypothetical protein
VSRLAYLALVGAIGCGSKLELAQVVPVDLGPDPLTVRSQCTSGLRRDPNESEGEGMMPGHACNACHAEANASSGEGDAPIFAYAGTVYPTGHEPDNCMGAGAEGAWVVVSDAGGAVHRSKINPSGNFLLEGAALAFPIRAKVMRDGKVREMKDAQDSGDCNRCHTEIVHPLGTNAFRG